MVRVFSLYLADKYWPCYQCLAGVQYDAGLAERLQRCFLSQCLAWGMRGGLWPVPLPSMRCGIGWCHQVLSWIS